MGQGNTIVSHFEVQRADLIVAIACVPCGPRRSLIYACEWGFGVCWKLSAAVAIKPDCCRPPAVVSVFTDSAAYVLSFYHSTPLHKQITSVNMTEHPQIMNCLLNRRGPQLLFLQSYRDHIKLLWQMEPKWTVPDTSTIPDRALSGLRMSAHAWK